MPPGVTGGGTSPPGCEQPAARTHTSGRTPKPRGASEDGVGCIPGLLELGDEALERGGGGIADRAETMSVAPVEPSGQDEPVVVPGAWRPVAGRSVPAPRGRSHVIRLRWPGHGSAPISDRRTCQDPDQPTLHQQPQHGHAPQGPLSRSVGSGVRGRLPIRRRRALWAGRRRPHPRPTPPPTAATMETPLQARFGVRVGRHRSPRSSSSRGSRAFRDQVTSRRGCCTDPRRPHRKDRGQRPSFPEFTSGSWLADPRLGDRATTTATSTPVRPRELAPPRVASSQSVRRTIASGAQSGHRAAPTGSPEMNDATHRGRSPELS
jgi:hypothetical protein